MAAHWRCEFADTCGINTLWIWRRKSRSKHPRHKLILRACTHSYERGGRVLSATEANLFYTKTWIRWTLLPPSRITRNDAPMLVFGAGADTSPNALKSPDFFLPG